MSGKARESTGLERHYSTVEVAERLGVLPVTVRRWIHSGRLRAVRVVREIRIPESAVLAILTDAREVPEALAEHGERMGELARKRAKAKRRGRKAKGKRAKARRKGKA